VPLCASSQRPQHRRSRSTQSGSALAQPRDRDRCRRDSQSRSGWRAAWLQRRRLAPLVPSFHAPTIFATHGAHYSGSADVPKTPRRGGDSDRCDVLRRELPCAPERMICRRAHGGRPHDAVNACSFNPRATPSDQRLRAWSQHPNRSRLGNIGCIPSFRSTSSKSRSSRDHLRGLRCRARKAVQAN
jgi:hypothetical protein